MQLKLPGEDVGTKGRLIMCSVGSSCALMSPRTTKLIPCTLSFKTCSCFLGQTVGFRSFLTYSFSSKLFFMLELWWGSYDSQYLQVVIPPKIKYMSVGCCTGINRFLCSSPLRNNIKRNSYMNVSKVEGSRIVCCQNVTCVCFRLVWNTGYSFSFQQHDGRMLQNT